MTPEELAEMFRLNNRDRTCACDGSEMQDSLSLLVDDVEGFSPHEHILSFSCHV